MASSALSVISFQYHRDERLLYEFKGIHRTNGRAITEGNPALQQSRVLPVPRSAGGGLDGGGGAAPGVSASPHPRGRRFPSLPVLQSRGRIPSASERAPQTHSVFALV